MRLVPLVLLAACGAAPATPPSNTAVARAPSVRATDPLGTLALVGAASSDTALPFTPVGATVLDPTNTVTGRVRIVSASAGAGNFIAGRATKVPFGCDGNQLDVTPLAGPSLPTGLAWVLPPAATWQPAPLAIISAHANTTARGYTVGPLRVSLRIDAPSRGTLSITRNDVPLGTRPFERQLMEGAEPSLATIDLVAGGPGVPVPVAAWALSDAGPYLIVLHVPSWEGLALEPFLVDAAVTLVEPMALYLYQCAF